MNVSNISLFYNGTIITVNKSDDITNAMCVYNDIILAVGNEEDVRKKSAQFIDQLDKSENENSA